MLDSIKISDLIVPALILGGASFIFLALMVGVVIQWIKVAAAHSWPVTQGTVLKSRISVWSGDTTDYRPFVTYQYQVGGQVYRNDLIAFGARYSSGGSSSDERDAQEVVARYPVGGQVDVHYHPQHPDNSVLEVRTVAARVYIIVGMIFWCLGIFAAALVLMLNVTVW